MINIEIEDLEIYLMVKYNVGIFNSKLVEQIP